MGLLLLTCFVGMLAVLVVRGEIKAVQIRRENQQQDGGNSTACNGNLVWSDCTSCESTCANPTPICIAECGTGCTCPQELPIMLKDDVLCGTLKDCPAAGIVAHTSCASIRKKSHCKTATGCRWKHKHQNCVDVIVGTNKKP